MYTYFNHFFTVTTRIILHIKVKLRRTSYLYYVITLPSKTRTTPKIALYMFALLMLMDYQQPQN